MNFTISDHLWFMSIALDLAEQAYKAQEVPVGSVLVSSTGDILFKQHNLKESEFNPIAHAEMMCLQGAGKKIQNWRLLDCVLYVTLEPCPMCLAAMLGARIGLCVFGAYDAKGGSISLGYNIHKDQRMNHQIDLIGGIKNFECSKILSQFFKEKRANYLPNKLLS